MRRPWGSFPKCSAGKNAAVPAWSGRLVEHGIRPARVLQQEFLPASKELTAEHASTPAPLGEEPAGGRVSGVSAQRFMDEPEGLRTPVRALEQEGERDPRARRARIEIERPPKLGLGAVEVSLSRADVPQVDAGCGARGVDLEAPREQPAGFREVAA